MKNNNVKTLTNEELIKQFSDIFTIPNIKGASFAIIRLSDLFAEISERYINIQKCARYIK